MPQKSRGQQVKRFKFRIWVIGRFTEVLSSQGPQVQSLHYNPHVITEWYRHRNDKSVQTPFPDLNVHNRAFLKHMQLDIIFTIDNIIPKQRKVHHLTSLVFAAGLHRNTSKLGLASTTCIINSLLQMRKLVLQTSRTHNQTKSKNYFTDILLSRCSILFSTDSVNARETGEREEEIH